MERKNCTVFFILCLITFGKANDSDWLTKPWSDHEPLVFHNLKNFAALFDSFQSDVNPQQVASGSQLNSHVIAHPFPRVFSQQYNFYPGQIFQQQPRALNFNNGNKHWNPQIYASRFPQGYHGPNQRYVIPKTNKQIPNYKNLENNKNIHSQDGPVPSNSYNRPSQIVPVGQPYEANRANILSYQRDPLIRKIKNDVSDNEKRLKEKEILNIHGKQQDENYTSEYEKHNPQDQPIYYSPPQNQLINHNRVNKLKYPRPNHENIKIHPEAYYPLKSHIRKLKENQGRTFADERNQYPEVKPNDDNDEEGDSEGHDIFDKQKTLFDNQKENFHSDFNDFTHEHHPQEKVLPQSVEQSDDNSNDNDNSDDDDERFIPIKMYAQVRHTETTKHLPQEAALEDAETFDEVLNAPRLREAIKTSKAQTVYTEEGYEDNAYDHAGHLKHASNHENHGGYVKNKNSGGDSNKGSGSNSYDDSGKSKHGRDLNKRKKWFVDEGKNLKFDNQHSYKQNDGNFQSNFRDLDGAGSEKLTIVPENIQVQDSNKKHTMTKSVEQKYEDIREVSDTKENKSDERREKIRKYLEKHRPIASTSSGFTRSEQLRNILALRHVPLKYRERNAAQITSNQFHTNSDSSTNPDVEVFKQDLKTNSGPRHGGNYQVHPTLFNYSKGKIAAIKILPKKHQDREHLNLEERRFSERSYQNSVTKLNPKSGDALETQSLLSTKPTVLQIPIRPIPTILPEKIYKDTIETLDEKPNVGQMFERLRKVSNPNERKAVADPEEIELEDTGITSRNQERAEIIEDSPSESTPDKQDQFPITSEVEVFRSDFKMNKGPKHGGNYKGKSSSKKKKGKSVSELEDLNGFQDDTEENLHGGNYRADEFEESNDDEVLPSSVVGNIAFLAANTTSEPIVHWKNT